MRYVGITAVLAHTAKFQWLEGISWGFRMYQGANKTVEQF